MDALVMCGGTGTRLGIDEEKPLYPIGGVPMIDRVIEALRASAVASIHAIGSPDVPETAAHLEAKTDDGTLDEYVEAGGTGYVADLAEAMDTVETPVLTVAADLPLLEGDAIDWVLESYREGSVTVCVPVALKSALGVSVASTKRHDGTLVSPTGVNVVGDPKPETILMTDDTRFAVNVNRTRDAWVAEVLA